MDMRRHGTLKKIALAAAVFTMLLVLSSCGIPTIANFDDYIDISTISSSSGVFTVSLQNTLNYTFRQNSPGLLLMYNISDSTNRTPVSVSSFNSTYGQISSGRPVNFSNDYSSETGDLRVQGGILNRTLGSQSASTGIYHSAFFPLIPEDKPNYTGISASNGYTLNLHQYLASSGGTVTFTIEFNEEDRCIYLTVENNPPVKLFRFNGNPFLYYNEISESDLNSNNLSSTYGDYWYFRRDDYVESNSLVINIYAAVNIMGDFSNLYWSDLERIGEIRF